MILDTLINRQVHAFGKLQSTFLQVPSITYSDTACLPRKRRIKAIVERVSGNLKGPSPTQSSLEQAYVQHSKEARLSSSKRSKEVKLGKCKKPDNVNPQSFEYLLHLTGDFGYFQCFMLIVLLGTEIPAAFVAFAPVFVGKQPESWVCNVNTDNESLVEQKTTDLCNCKGTLTPSDAESSIVTEWNLFCGSSFVSDFITSIQMLGMLTGSLFTSQFSDWYGRKKTYLFVCIIMCVGQGLSAAAPSPIYYATARFLCGAGLSGFMGMSTIYPMEFLTPKWRQLCGSVGPWGEGVMLLALMAYFWRNWRQFLWISCLPFILVIFICPFVPESPRWLLRNKRLEDALQVFKKIHQMNAKPGEPFPITIELLEKISNEECRGMDQSKFTYLDFFRSKELRRKTLFLMGIWFSWACVYFGISYNIKNIKGDPYLNVALLGLADALGYPFALCINNRLGRRKTLIAFMSLGTIFLVALAILDLTFGVSLNSSLVAALCLLGKFGVAGARSAARCLTGESFPTPIRTMGYGISGVTAGVGGIIAPQLAYFGSQWWHPLPFATFALISVGGSAISLLLPETADKTLEERMELEGVGRREKPGETSEIYNNVTAGAV
ncbi:unnamed protein product [Allacma fusca]|uniref:Major facilitator superfamily (MFS) profile domain-containing protein n=1 Tax=Allacma fusca TaxID=39272 RepID=A0A8J2JW90_9HEXA|nr:unnamed protein product [Allacma fusca]